MARMNPRIPDDYEPTQEDLEAHRRVEIWQQRMQHRMEVDRGNFETVLEGDGPVIRTSHGEEPSTFDDIAELYERLGRGRAIRDGDGTTLGMEFGS